MDTSNDNQILSEENRKNVINFSFNNLLKNSVIGGITGLILGGITKRKWPFVFTMSYFVGKSFAESDNYLKQKLEQKL